MDEAEAIAQLKKWGHHCAANTGRNISSPGSSGCCPDHSGPGHGGGYRSKRISAQLRAYCAVQFVTAIPSLVLTDGDQ